MVRIVIDGILIDKRMLEEKKMRAKSVLILVSVAAILIVAGMGNASAKTFDYGSSALSSLDYGDHATLISGSPTTHFPQGADQLTGSDYVGWGNQFKNENNAPSTGYLNYWISPTSGDLSLPTYGVSLNAGQLVDVSWYSHPGSAVNVYETISANHAYTSSGSPSRNTATWSGFTFTRTS